MGVARPALSRLIFLWAPQARRFYASPAVFAAAFTLGFLLTFGPGVLLFLGGDSVEELLAAHRLDDVIVELHARESAKKMTPHDWLIYGHALHRKAGAFYRKGMLDKYAQAVREKVVDSTALNNTITALADDDSRDRAMLLLTDWPKTEGVAVDADQALAARVTNENFALRHAALDALAKRKAPAPLIVMATAAVALQDVKSMSCADDAARVGLQAMKRIADGDREQARAAFAVANPLDLLRELDAAGRSTLACVDGTQLRQTQQAVSTVLKDP